MRTVNTVLTGFSALLIGLPPGAQAQDTNLMPDSVAAAEADALPSIQRRATDIAELFRADPGGYDEVFAGPFLAQIPAAALDQVFTGVHAEHGRALDAEVVGPFTGGVSIIRLYFEDGTAALLQLGIEPAPPHRVTGAQLGPVFEVEGAAAARGAFRISVPTYPTDDYETRTTLRLPFEGEWWVFWGGRSREENYHRASALQRYAYDFVIRRDGSTHRGDGNRNEDYWCEGEPVLAPAAGTVVVAEDGVPENVPGEMNAGEKLGNHVVIDHGNGEFSLFAHLQTGSVSVERGAAVEPGTPVGACGNSGNSSEPHLHYQLQTGPDFFASESVPAPFHDYVADGERVEVGEPRSGQTVAPMPAADTIIRSDRWPAVDVAVDPTFRHLGSRVVDLGGAEAEIHVLADIADDGRLERFYWIQFEGRKPGSPGRYDYSDLPHVDTIDGYHFDQGARYGAYTSDEIENERDTNTVGRILAEHGFDFPAPMMRVRMATIDESARNELLVIYMEALSWSGTALRDLEADEAAWTRAAAALRERAADGLGLGAE